MSKASEFSRVAGTRPSVKLDEYAGGFFERTARVTDGGWVELFIQDPGERQIRIGLDPEQARKLGRWLVETFEER